MKLLKTILLLSLGILLINFTSALLVAGSWEDGTMGTAITNGESISFSALFASYYAPMDISAALYDSVGVLLPNGVFLADTITTNPATFQEVYTITPAIYVTPGSYELRLSATDSITSRFIPLTLTVNPVVTPPITGTAPTINLIGANPIVVQVYGVFTEPGATANDAEDGSLTSSIVISGSVNTNIVGSYTLTYSVTDSDGNLVSVTRTVNIVDTISPVITLNGTNPLTIVQGNPYTELGATVTDNYDIVSTVIISGSVNTNIVGIYTVTYTSMDSSGNIGTNTRTVNVIANDTTPPVISILFPSNGGNYDENDVTTLQVQITDANLQSCWYRKNGGSSIFFTCTSGSIINIPTNPADGSNTWTVYANDTFGNQASTSVTFDVEENSNGGSSSGGGASVTSGSVTEPTSSGSESEIYLTPKTKTGVFSATTLLFITTGIVGLGILLVGYLLFMKLRKK